MTMQATRKSHAWPGCRLATAAALLLALATTPAFAQSREQSCQPVGEGGYTLDGTTNVASKAGGGQVGSQIKSKTNLRRLEGNCAAGGELYPFKQQVVGITVEIVDGGKRVERRFLCTTQEYATPAGTKCEREIRRIDWAAPDRQQQAYR